MIELTNINIRNKGVSVQLGTEKSEPLINMPILDNFSSHL